MPDVDTSAEAVERKATWLEAYAERHDIPAGCAGALSGSAATLRALVAERDALVRDNATLVEGITAANNACCAAEAIIAAAPKGGSDGE